MGRLGSATVVRGLRLLMVLTLAVAGDAHAASSSVSVVGEYTNMRFTAEHAYGYTVELWREGGRLFGLFLASDGLQGDTPTGLLERVVLDPPTGGLSFFAKLTTGLAYLGPEKQVPTRDPFEFRGTLSTQMLAGTLRRSDMLRPKSALLIEQVRLRKGTGSLMIHPASYTEWKRWADEILKLRGPRW